MADRVPLFEMHILPMFRLIDIEHMMYEGWNLRDYEVVKGEADKILDFLKASSSMPPKDAGGPWPDEWIALFERWIENGYRRLALNKGQNYLLTRDADNYTLSCTVSLPYFGAKSWLEINSTVSSRRRYTLVLEELDPPPAPTPVEFTLRDRFTESTPVAGVYVSDADGEHFVGIPIS